MKNIIGILLAIGLFSCQEKQPESNISGTAKGMKDGTKIFVATIGENNRPVPVDTAVVKNESFTLDLEETDTQQFNTLSVENIRGNSFFIWANQDLKIDLYKDSLNTSQVSGGKHNKLLAQYFDYMQSFGKSVNNLRNQMQVSRSNPQKITQLQMEQKALIEEGVEFRKNLLKNNPNSLVAVMALTDLLQMNSLSVTESKELFESLSDEMKNSPIGQQIEKQLSVALATAVGNKAPRFSGPTPTGETLALNDAMGKVTLVDFWASWCKPCRIENPNIVRVYEKYHDKGLNIVGVSLDKNKQKWLEAIEADGLTWSQISHLRFWQDPIAQKYNVRSIPAAFLLDENGVIVAKDLRGKELENKVAELLEGE